MVLRRWAFWTFLAVVWAGCHDEEFVTVVSSPPTSFSAPSSATGLTGFDEEIGAADIGSDGQPRLVFKRKIPGTSPKYQVLFTRRRSTGSWTTPLPLSAEDADDKTAIQAYVTTSNDFTHVFWLEAGEVHYARVNNADPPALDTQGGDAIISAPAPTAASELAVAVDRLSNTVFAIWIQSASGAGSVPVVGEVPAAGPTFGNRVPLVTPGSSVAASSPLLRVSSAGVVHAAWVGTDGDGNASLLRYAQRASAEMWTASPGEAVSDTGAAGHTIDQADLLLAADGDVYAVWYDKTTDTILADRRASGGSFGTDVTVKDYAALTSVSLRAVLESGTERLHVIWREGAVPGPVGWYAQRQDAADLGGNWLESEETIHTVTTATGDSVDFDAWADSTGRVIVAYQAPSVAGDLSRTWIRVHPSGAATFEAAGDLTASYALPCRGLKVSPNGSGTALLVWEQGNRDDIPLSDVVGAVYSSGGGIGGASNISGSAAFPSLAPFALRLTDGNVGHLFWHEQTATGLNDIGYARTQ